MATAKIPRYTTETKTQPKRDMSALEREQTIQRLIWTAEVEGIEVTREEAEQAIDWALTQPLPEF